MRARIATVRESASRATGGQPVVAVFGAYAVALFDQLTAARGVAAALVVVGVKNIASGPQRR